MNEPAFVAETLAWCNKMRDERGLEPLARLPKGDVGDPRSCPCGKATGLHVEWWAAYEPLSDWQERPPICSLPDAVQQFVKAFDRGELPQYVRTA